VLRASRAVRLRAFDTAMVRLQTGQGLTGF